jgi:nucleotide-binding universal stress UspA family protein
VKTLEIGNAVTLKKVLFATDFSSSSETALGYALAIAERYGAKLYAAHIESADSYLFATPESWPVVIDREGRGHVDVTHLERHLRSVPRQLMSAAGDTSDVLFRLVRDHEIDLLVLGTHGRSGLPKLLMGSVAEKIFRLASCPVLTVGPHVLREPKRGTAFQRIVFATDFSDKSLAAASYAISLAREHKAHLFLLHVLERPESGTVDCASNAEFIIGRMRELLPPDSELWFQSNYAVEFGVAEEQILKFAERVRADLIVLGVQAPPGALTTLTRLAHSRSHHIVAHAPCPVLTVRG